MPNMAEALEPDCGVEVVTDPVVSLRPSESLKNGIERAVGITQPSQFSSNCPAHLLLRPEGLFRKRASVLHTSTSRPRRDLISDRGLVLNVGNHHSKAGRKTRAEHCRAIESGKSACSFTEIFEGARGR